jgi:potassium voltage-gated channel Eag-related subfamily H protein 1
LRIYLSCIYYIVATLATVGYGDIHATQEGERVLAIGIMLVGTIVFALIISTASMIVQNSNIEDAAHGSKIAMVHEFCNSWKVNETLKYDILDFYLSSKDVFFENANTKSVMSALPPEYQNMVAPHVAKECIARTVLFKGCNPAFFSLLLESLQLESFSAGEVLFRSGDVPHSMFIIKSGTCLFINDSNTVIAELTDSDIFGEVSCFLSMPRSCTCVCTKFCELYALHCSGLAKLFKMFPDFRHSFSVYCRRKILVDASTKRQFSALFHDKPQPSESPCKYPPQSPSLGAKSPSLGSKSPSLGPQSPFVEVSAKRALKPLPKGKYRPPAVPDLAQMMRLRTTQATHAEKIRLFAEIQVTCMPFLFFHHSL